MRSRMGQFIVLGFGLTVLAAAVVLLKFDNARLRARVADAQRRQGEVVRLRDEIEQTRQLIAKAQVSEEAAGESLHGQVLRLRSEVDRLEKQARGAAAVVRQTAADRAAQLATNRDLRRGLVRLENLVPAGHGAPDAALQTLIWSAVKGDTATLHDVIGLSDDSRAEAKALVATLPEAARLEWSPERLAALFFTGFFTEISAAAVESVTLVDFAHATVALRVTNGVKEKTIPLTAVATPEGWRITPPEGAMAGMRRRIPAPGAPAPGK